MPKTINVVASVPFGRERCYRSGMSYEFQVVVDAVNPHAQADWWAAALGWEVEPSDEAFIRKMVDTGYAAEEDALEWNGVLVWTLGAAIRDPENVGRPRVLFQAVSETKSVKNRLHLDIRAGEKRQSKADELIRAGAAFLWRGEQGPQWWITLADPEGNEFCVA